MARSTAAVSLAALVATAAAQDLRLRDGGAATRFVTDTARGRVVALGTHGEIDEWDGSRHYSRPMPWPGGSLEFHAAAYDPVDRSVLALRHRTTVQTWRFDGAAWSQLAPAATPAGAWDTPALAFNGTRGRVLLFGGATLPGTFPAETWEWTGTTWAQLLPPASPTGRGGAGLAFDQSRQRAVLFGGRDAAGVLRETWEWDGTTWLQRQPAATPAARWGHAMGYDPARQRTVLFGGSTSATAGDTTFAGRNDLWEYDGINWTSVAGTGPVPAPRVFATFCVEPGSGELLLLGGNDNGIELRDSTRWNGTRWQRAAAVQKPPSRDGSAATYEASSDAVLVYGSAAVTGPPVPLETWRWDGSHWTSLGATGPAGRNGPVMWSDLIGVFLFSGSNASPSPIGPAVNLLNDTWRWNGTAWMQLTPAMVPPPRSHAAAAYDFARSSAVLFGGTGTAVLGDTWTFDGSNWQQRAPSSAPAPRFAHAMANDLLRNRVVLFGGHGSTGPLGDTWEWDGTTWLPMAPAASPPAGSGGMEFDLQVGRITLALNQGGLYRYDGSTWTPVALATQPPMLNPLLVCRLQAQRLELLLRDHVYAVSQVPVQVIRYGAGCGADPPLLSARCWPRLGAADFGLELLRAPANALCGIVGGLQQASVPIGPCTQLVSPIAASVFLLANGGGFAQQGIAIPANATLLGAQLFFQGAELDPSAPAGFKTTAGLRVVVGD